MALIEEIKSTDIPDATDVNSNCGFVLINLISAYLALERFNYNLKNSDGFASP